MKGYGYNILSDKLNRPYARRDAAKTMTNAILNKAVRLRPHKWPSKVYPYNSTKRHYHKGEE